MATLSDIRNLIYFISDNAKIFPHVDRALVVCRDSLCQNEDGLGFLSDAIADEFSNNANAVLKFTLDVSFVTDSTSDSIHSTCLDLERYFSNINFFCVVDVISQAPSLINALTTIKKVAAPDALMLLLVPNFDRYDPRFCGEVRLFTRQNLVDIFGDSLLFVEEFGYSWLVLTHIPEKFNDIRVFNVKAQQLLPISSEWYPPFFTSHQLDDIGIDCATDKSSRYHDYLMNYEFFLSRFKSESFTLMELGVLYGSSVKMWSQYFPNAQIVGVDIDSECLKYQTDNIHIEITDLRNVDAVIKLRDFKPTIIIDDASHSWKDQILAISLLFSSLPHGGVYIVEDLETSFLELAKELANFQSYFDFNIDAFSFIEAINRVIVSGTHIEDAVDPSTSSSLKNLSIGGMNLCEIINSIGSSALFVALMHGSVIFVKR